MLHLRYNKCIWSLKSFKTPNNSGWPVLAQLPPFQIRKYLSGHEELGVRRPQSTRLLRARSRVSVHISKQDQPAIDFISIDYQTLNLLLTYHYRNNVRDKARWKK